MALVTVSADAGTVVWNNSGNDFNAGSSWATGVAPGEDDICFFSGAPAPAAQPVLTADITVDGLNFGTTGNLGYHITALSEGVVLSLGSDGTGASAAISSTSETASNRIDVPLVLLGSTPTIRSAASYAGTLVLGGPIGSPGDIVLTLEGAIALLGANTYTGVTKLPNFIHVGNKSAFGQSTLNVAGFRYLTPVAPLAGADRIMNPILLAHSGGTSALTVLDSSFEIEFGGNITVEGTSGIISNQSPAGTTVSGVIDGRSLEFRSPSGVLRVLGANTFDFVRLESGTISVPSIGNAGAPGPLGRGTQIVLAGATLLYTGPGETTDKIIDPNAGSHAIESSGTGPLVFTSSMPVQTGMYITFALGGTNSGDNRFEGSINDPIKLIKRGPGTWILSGSNTYTGGTRIDDGVLKLSGNGNLGQGGLTVAGGVLDLNSTHQILFAPLSMSGGIIRSDGGGGSLIVVGSNMLGAGVIDAVLGGPGALEKTGGGTLTLSAYNTYTGGTTVSEGILVFGTSLGSGSVSVAAGATLSSTAAPVLSATVVNRGTIAAPGITFAGPLDAFGSVVGDATVSGILRPAGASVGSASFSGNLTLGAASSTSLQISGPSTSDQFTVTGTLVLDGTVTVSLDYIPAGPATFTLFHAGAVNASSFDPSSDLILPALSGGYTWDTSSFLESGQLRIEAPTLELSGLTQTYSGSSRVVGVTTTPPGLVVSVTYDGSTTPPVHSGSYTVVASLLDAPGESSVSGVLVVEKAPLTIVADDQFKLLNAPLPTFTLSYAGLVGGDTPSVLDQLPAIATTATAKSKAGAYPITLSGGADGDYTLTLIPGTLTVTSLAGSYEAALTASTETMELNGKLGVTTSAANTGFTATLNLADEGKVLALKGTLTPAADFDGAVGTVTLRRALTKTTSLTYRLEIELRPQALAARIYRDDLLVAEGEGPGVLILPRGAKAGWAGAYTAPLLTTGPVSEADVRLYPAGAGGATVTVANSGTLTLKGKLADGRTLSGSSKSGVAESGGNYRLFARPYGTRGQSYFAGVLAGPAAAPEGFLLPALPAGGLPGNFVWKKAAKPAAAKAENYDLGFAVAGDVALYPWRKPSAATKTLPAVTLANLLGLSATGDFEIVHEGVELGALGDELPTAATLNSKGKVVAPGLAAENPTAWKATFTAATGAFSGSFTLIDAVPVPDKPDKIVKRTVKFSGVLRQPASDSAETEVIGLGQFLVPPLAADGETRSGEIRLLSPAP